MKTIMKVLPLVALLAGLSACGKPRPREDWNNVDILITHLTDPDHTARRNAAVALGIMGERAVKALEALEKARDDEDWKVRESVEIALSRILRALDRRAAASAALMARSRR